MRRRFLIIGIVLLFVCVSFNPSSALDNPVSSGNTLYVGGSGEGNYTRIQDAIDNVSDGDTVFVYDDSSPYYENLVINTSITLLGEDKNTTIIDGMENPENQIDIIIIYADGVTVTGFTIKNSYWPYYYNVEAYYCGIEIWSDGNKIRDNNIVDNFYGILIGSFGSNFYTKKYSDNNVIEENSITENEFGISLLVGTNNLVSNNYISLNNFSVSVHSWANDALVTFNTVSSNKYGIILNGVKNVTITRNTITQNYEYGILIEYSKRIMVLENNIYGNKIDVFFITFSYNFINWMINEFDGNFWGIMQQKPVFVPGKMYFVILTGFFLRLQDFLNQGDSLFGIPLIKIDRHPAKEPYDIPTGV